MTGVLYGGVQEFCPRTCIIINYSNKVASGAPGSFTVPPRGDLTNVWAQADHPLFVFTKPAWQALEGEREGGFARKASAEREGWGVGGSSTPLISPIPLPLLAPATQASFHVVCLHLELEPSVGIWDLILNRLNQLRFCSIWLHFNLANLAIN